MNNPFTLCKAMENIGKIFGNFIGLNFFAVIGTFFQVDELFREAPIKGQKFNYIEFTRILKHGRQEQD